MTPTNILQSPQSDNVLKITTVSEVMQAEVTYVSPCTDLFNIAQIMASENISSVVIAQQGIVGTGKVVFPVGIIAERDIELLQALQQDLGNIEAKTVMNGSFSSVRATDSLFDALSEMQRSNLQQLMVIGDGDELVGIVTQSSCLQLDASVKKKT